MGGRAVKQKTLMCVPVLKDTRESTVKQTPTTVDQTPAYMEHVGTMLLAITANATLATRDKTAIRTLTIAIHRLVCISETAPTTVGGFLVNAPLVGRETFASKMSTNACGRCRAITMPPARTQRAIFDAFVLWASKEKGKDR